MPRGRKTSPTPKQAAPENTCVIYARVSSREQAEGYSLDAQLGLLRGYAIAKGLTVVAEFAEPESAKTAGRRHFGEALHLIRTRKARALVVEKTDRLYRNLKDRVLVDESRAEVHLVKEGAVITPDSKSHEKFVHDIKVTVAKLFIDNLKEEAEKGILEKLNQGGWPGAAPLGYINTRRDGRNVVDPDPARAVLVRRLFEEFAKGQQSTQSLHVFAASIGLTNRRGNALVKSQVYWILTNPFYTGRMVWKGQTYKGNHPPLISEALFAKVQEILTGRTSGSAPKSKREFAYKGIIRCGVCGCLCSPYTVRKPSGAEFTYYACTGARGCPRKGMREEAITEQLIAAIEAISLPPSWVAEMRRQLIINHETQATDIRTRRLALDEKHDMTVKSLERLYLDRIEGIISPATYDSLRARQEKELDAIEQSRAALASAQARTLQDQVTFLEALSNCHIRFKTAAPHLKRILAGFALSNLTLTQGTLTVMYKPWFQKVAETKQTVLSLQKQEDRMKQWQALLDDLLTAA